MDGLVWNLRPASDFVHLVRVAYHHAKWGGSDVEGRISWGNVRARYSVIFHLISKKNTLILKRPRSILLRAPAIPVLTNSERWLFWAPIFGCGATPAPMGLGSQKPLPTAISKSSFPKNLGWTPAPLKNCPSSVHTTESFVFWTGAPSSVHPIHSRSLYKMECKLKILSSFHSKFRYVLGCQISSGLHH